MSAGWSPESYQLMWGAGAAWSHSRVDAPSAWLIREARGGTQFTPTASMGMSQTPVL